MQHLGKEHGGELRPYGDGEGARADRNHCEARQKPLTSYSINERAPRQLPKEGDDASDREHEADIGIGPFLGRQIDSQERAETHLNVGDEKRKPVDADVALAGRSSKFRPYRPCHLPHRSTPCTSAAHGGLIWQPAALQPAGVSWTF